MIKPRLELVPASAILFHEQAQHRRTLRLMERIRQENLLRNPPIVAQLGDAEFLLLDGANRVSALLELGYADIPVQIVDYADAAVQLKGWQHLIIQGRSLHLQRKFEMLSGIHMALIQPDQIKQSLELREVLAIFVDENEVCRALHAADQDSFVDCFVRIDGLTRIVGAYEGQSDLERIKLAEFSSLSAVIRSVEHQLCLYPVLTKEELIELSRAQVMIPTGITRHLIPGRALGLNLNLRFLKTASSSEAKQDHFKHYLEQLEIHGRLRFYEESTFIMNE